MKLNKIGLAFILALTSGSVTASPSIVKDMSGVHVNWTLKEAENKLRRNDGYTAYLELEYYLLKGDEEAKSKVREFIVNNPEILDDAVNTFNGLSLHKLYKAFGFDKVKAAKGAKLRLAMFKEFASDEQYNQALASAIEYLGEDVANKVSLSDGLAAIEEANRLLEENKIDQEKKKKQQKADIAKAVDKRMKSVGKVTYGNWYTYVEKDDFTDEIQAEAFVFGKKVYNDYMTLGIRCFSGNVRLTFDMAKFVAFGGNDVSIRYRVNDKSSGSLNGRLYSNSNKGGYDDYTLSNPLLSEMKQGSRLLLEVANDRRSNVYQSSFSLSGFTKAYNRINYHCK